MYCSGAESLDDATTTTVYSIAPSSRSFSTTEAIFDSICPQAT